MISSGRNKNPYYKALITHSRRFVLDLQSYDACFSMPRSGTALPSATRPPAAAQRCHARPTRHKVLSAKERPPTPPSTTGDRRKASIPDRAGDRINMQIPLPFSNTTSHVLLLYVLLRCCTWWVGGTVGGWVCRVLHVLLLP